MRAEAAWLSRFDRVSVFERDRSLILALIAGGLVLRLLYLAVAPWQSGGGEAENVAVALANGRGFADAYFVGSGPTAHLTPTTPVLAGLAYRLLGVQSPAANAVLIAWSMACFAASVLLLNRLFRLLGAPVIARVGATALICLAPVFLVHETLVFRFWEGQLTFALLLLSLSRSVQLATGADKGGQAVGPALLIAVTALFNPMVGLAASLAHGTALLGRGAWRRLLFDAVLVLACVALPLAAWAARNQRMLGAPILLRDNVGLELSFKNNDDALRLGPTAAVIDRHYRYHPGQAGPGAVRLREVGELAFMEEVKRQSFGWIAAHPAGFVTIALQGWVEFFFPPRRHFQTAGLPRTALLWLVDAIGLLTLGIAVVQRRQRWMPVAVAVVALSAVYAPFIYLWRYHYPVYNILVFAAATGICSFLARRWRGGTEHA